MSTLTFAVASGAGKRDYEPVGFVVVGLGMGHSRAKLIAETAGTRLIGVADSNEERAKKTSSELNVPYKLDFRAWLDNRDVDAVYVLTETGNHATVATAALEAGKHVLITKPMEASLDACDRMITLAEQKELLLGIDFEMRLLPETLALKAAVENRKLGRLLGGQVSLRIQRTAEYFKANGGWRGTRRLDGGGVLSNQAIHHIDQIAYAVGTPHRVRCEIRTQTHNIETEDIGCALWEYADGALISVFATTSFPQETWHPTIALHGTKGAALLSSGGPHDSKVEQWLAEGKWSDRPPAQVSPIWMNAADNFAAALRTGATLVCSGRDGRATQAILDAMYRSAFKNGDWAMV